MNEDFAKKYAKNLDALTQRHRAMGAEDEPGEDAVETKHDADTPPATVEITPEELEQYILPEAAPVDTDRQKEKERNARIKEAEMEKIRRTLGVKPSTQEHKPSPVDAIRRAMERVAPVNGTLDGLSPDEVPNRFKDPNA